MLYIYSIVILLYLDQDNHNFYIFSIPLQLIWIQSILWIIWITIYVKIQLYKTNILMII